MRLYNWHVQLNRRGMRLVDIWYLHMAYENHQGFKTCQTGKYGTSEIYMEFDVDPLKENVLSSTEYKVQQ